MTCIAYAHASALVGGANKVLLRLIDRLDRGRYQPVSIIPEAGPMVDELRSRDVPCVVHEVRADRLSRWKQAAVAGTLAVRLMRYRPHLLHANELPYRIAALAAIGARRVCHIHHPGSTPEGLRWMLATAPDLIISPSRYVRDEVATTLRQCHIETRTEVAYNPIDMEWFRPVTDIAATRRALGVDPAEQHIVILGALAPHKGHVCFLRMAKRVLDSLPQTQFHIVGGDLWRDGQHSESLRHLAEELGDSLGRVRFWGFVTDETARDLLAASDLFVLPTKEEGFGLVVAEAQACEVPVLTSAIQPLDEVVDDGRTGFLLDPEDDAAFASHAIQLLRDKEISHTIGQAGREWVQQRSSQDAQVQRITSLYDELLGIAPTPAGVTR